VERTGEKTEALGNEPTPEANSYGVGSASRLELREQMPDVGLHGLLRQEEPLADLAVDEAVGHELKHLDLPHRGLLLELTKRRRERDHRAAARVAALRRCLVEASTVVHITAQDLLALGSVHVSIIGARQTPL
jgi:hypothetical protein